MAHRWAFCRVVAGALLASSAVASTPQQTGSIRGVVHDDDFDVPIGGVQVQAAELGRQVVTSGEGHYLIDQVPPGRYLLVFSKEGYVRQVKSDVVVVAGQLTDLDVRLVGEFTELEEFVVQDILQVAAESEIALIDLRLGSPTFLDSIGAELMSRAGASDAAAGLRLVAGASVADGKTAVIRGLPDRYVSSQLNSVRLPSADEDKRAVELDQFPAAVIESLQVSKTFTPEEQGDASGGAVNVRLKGIPDARILQFKSELSYNTNTPSGSDFLTYEGGGVNFLGKDDGDRDQQLDRLGENWDGAVGVTGDDAPIDYKWSIDYGDKFESDGVTYGGFASLFYERDSSFYDDGQDDSKWIVNPGDPLTPEYSQGVPDIGTNGGSYRTALFDVTRASESVQWGLLTTLGVSTEKHSVNLTGLFSRTTEDVAILAEDTRSKQFFFPGFDPDDPSSPGYDDFDAAPYIRTETLEYTERETGSLQLHGDHALPLKGWDIGSLTFKPPELDWVLARSFADLDQPDKRQFGAIWRPNVGGFWEAYKPAATFLLGNLQRIWTTIEEDSNQGALSLKFPFEQWSRREGYAQFGVFADRVDRAYDQDTFSNLQDPNTTFNGAFEDFWSASFPFEDHPISDGPPFIDVDYDAEQDITAWHGMIDLPLTKPLNVIGGVRLEKTEVSVVNHPEEDATWFPPGSTGGVALDGNEADVDSSEDDVLPAVGLVYTPVEEVTLRGSYSETIARPTFKELTPILQYEYLGGPLFIGNPELQMSSLKNYDLRADWTPYEGALVSASWFYKDIDGPIEYRQRSVTDLTFTEPRNYPEGKLDGYEVEVRQSLGRFSEKLDGIGVGANATFIDSEVTLPDDEITILQAHEVNLTTRDATNAPEYIYNLYLTYDADRMRAAVFYTVQGDTLVSGAGAQAINETLFVPDVYQEDYGTLNVTVSWRLGEHSRLVFQAKNITDPTIEEVYRFHGDTTKTSYTRGAEYSIGLSLNL